VSEAVTIRAAGPADAAILGTLVAALLAELSGRSEEARSPAALTRLAEELLATPSGYSALIAEGGAGRPLAVLTLTASAAVYAGGRFGTIAEFYVVPEQRSGGLGARLVAAAVEEARRRGWRRLEVGAPAVPLWQRSVDFYRRCGFAEIGPRLSLPVT